MYKAWGILLAAFAIQSAMHGQSASIDIRVDRTELANGSVSFTGIAKNLTADTKGYTYTMKTIKSGQNGSSNNTQTGSFTLEGDEVEALSIVTFGKLDNQRIEIELVVLDRSEEVARITYVADATDRIIMDSSADKPTPKSSIDSVAIERSTVLNLPTTNSVESTPISDLEIDGLIINETRSKAGRDFYGFFYKNWQAPQEASNFTIILKEYPTRGRLARVGVEVNGTLVYQPVLQPRQAIVEMSANQAILIVKNYLIEQSKITTQIESEDQAGSGLF